MFYLSSYLEKHRDEYYLRLREISDKGKWDSWVIFYLKAVIEQSKQNSSKVKEIIQLYFEMRDHIVERTRSQYAHQLLDAIFIKPIFRSLDIQKRSKIPKQSLMPMLKQIQEDKILITIREARGRMAAILVFGKLLEIIEGKQFLILIIVSRLPKNDIYITQTHLENLLNLISRFNFQVIFKSFVCIFE